MQIITNELIQTIVNVLIVPILGIVSAYVVQLIKTKISSMSDEQFKNYLSSSLDELHQAVNTAVSKVSQTYVDSLKKEGKFNVEEQKIAFKSAYDTAIAILSNDTADFLKKQLTAEGFEEIITSKIEELVGLNKQFNNTYNRTFITDSDSTKTDNKIKEDL